MSNIGFTPQQNKAIYTRGSDLLVAAAAGSGKTAVLVERIINIVTDMKKPVDIDRLLVVTFTEAAAGEMRQRISSALYDRLVSDPENEQLRRQVALLNKASITTIHSFCLDVIRKNFHLVDLDPSFKIGDRGEINLLKSEVLEALFENEYAKDNNQPFFDLVESYGGNKTRDDGLAELVLTLFSFISNLPWPQRWIEKNLDMFHISNQEDLAQTVWLQMIRNRMVIELEGVRDNINQAMGIANGFDGPAQYVETLMEDGFLVDALLHSCKGTFDDMYEAFSQIKFKELSRKKSPQDVSEEAKERIKTIRKTEIKAVIDKLKERLFFKSPQGMLEDLQRLHPVMTTLCNLTLSFSDAYGKAKRERNIADFNDLEHYCLEILLEKESTEENPIPTKTACERREKYEEVMIDEYQDSNLVQELMLSAVSKTQPPNRFMVGDIKQSIYKFRRANPEIFLKKYNSFSDIEGTSRLKVDLAMNFRSRGVVLDFVNFIFEQIMTESVGELKYDENAALYTGASFPEPSEDEKGHLADDVELHIIQREMSEPDMAFGAEESEDDLMELSKIEMEAKTVALRIQELLNGENKMKVYDQSEKMYRDATYKDIVILTRSANTIAEIFVETLKEYDIPALANSDGGYFQSIEVSTMIGFLQTIDNPLQDIHLITVLRSPVYMFSSDELLEIRQIKQKGTFYDCIELYLSENNTDKEEETIEKLTTFVKDLKRWRDLAVYTPISELIDILYDETDYFNYAGVMLTGGIRQANLRMLQEKAIQYETTSFKGLFHFIKYIEKIQRASGDQGGAKLLSENENIVRIMTIHKSKGLEFPIVFVCMLGKQFNAMDERKNMILHQELGLGPTYINLETRTKTNTLARVALAQKTNQENLSEEMRVLYVALTRAKEKLILTGSVSKLKENMTKWSQFVSQKGTELPIYYMLKGKCFLDWICGAVARHRDGEMFRTDTVSGFGAGNEALFGHSAKIKVFIQNHFDIVSKDNKIKEETQFAYEELKQLGTTTRQDADYEEIDRKFSWIYPFNQAETLPTKVSISEIKRLYQKQMFDGEEVTNLYEQPIRQKPEFLKTQTELTGGQLGTAIHTVMEHLDLHRKADEAYIQGLIQDLMGRNILTEQEGTAIPVDKIIKFSQSETGERIRQARLVKRETPFVMGLTPYEVYQEEQYKDSQETVLVHGIIDCYFEEDDEIVIVDYKSDTVKSLEDMKEKYSLQLSLYRQAIQGSTGKKVKECILYLFHIDKELYISE